MAVTETGLRERKKQKTKEAIESAAMELFARKGYDATTVAEIAEAADVAPRTFFAYFPSKEDVAFCTHDRDLTEMRDYLAARPEGESAIECIRAFIAERMTPEFLDTDREALKRKLLAENKSLAARNRLLMREFEQVLAEAVVTDLDTEPDDLRTQFVAAATIAVMATLADHFGEGGEPKDAESIRPVDDALRFLRGGVEALGQDPA